MKVKKERTVCDAFVRWKHFQMYLCKKRENETVDSKHRNERGVLNGDANVKAT